MLPKEPISPEAQQVTGIVVVNNEMTVNGQSVQASSIKEALGNFCEFLDRYTNVVLVASIR